MDFTISQLAGKAGVTKDTIFYYEKQGLIMPESRTNSNYRLYNESSVERITFIKSAQKLGFTLAEVKELLGIKQSKFPCPNALDYVIRKLGKTKNQITKLTNQKDSLEMLMKECGKSEDASVCTFFEYLERLPCRPTSELIFCRHTYLYDQGQWTLEGNFQIAGESSVGMTGSIEILHENNVWNVLRTVYLKDEKETVETIQFYIPPAEDNGHNQKFVADCSVFGDVTGSISFAGEDIFKSYEMPDQGVKGCEYLKRIHTDLYEARGVLNDGTKSISWWDYQMQRGHQGGAKWVN